MFVDSFILLHFLPDIFSTAPVTKKNRVSATTDKEGYIAEYISITTIFLNIYNII